MESNRTIAELSDEALSSALDDALKLGSSKDVWAIVDEMERRDRQAEL